MKRVLPVLLLTACQPGLPPRLSELDASIEALHLQVEQSQALVTEVDAIPEPLSSERGKIRQDIASWIGATGHPDLVAQEESDVARVLGLVQAQRQSSPLPRIRSWEAQNPAETFHPFDPLAVELVDAALAETECLASNHRLFLSRGSPIRVSARCAIVSNAAAMAALARAQGAFSIRFATTLGEQVKRTAALGASLQALRLKLVETQPPRQLLTDLDLAIAKNGEAEQDLDEARTRGDQAAETPRVDVPRWNNAVDEIIRIASSIDLSGEGSLDGFRVEILPPLALIDELVARAVIPDLALDDPTRASVDAASLAVGASLTSIDAYAHAGGTRTRDLHDHVHTAQDWKRSAETNLSFLLLQAKPQELTQQYTQVSNIMKTKHDTVKNSISNVR
jgi:hypothetical protein